MTDANDAPAAPPPPKKRSGATGPADWSDVPIDSGRERRLVASRIALASRVIATISAIFFLLNAILSVSAGGMRLVPYALAPSTLAHLAAIVAVAAIGPLAQATWRSERTLAALDVGGVVAQSAMYALISAAAPFQTFDEGVMYVPLLATLLIVLGRSIIVPSTARRTLVASTIAFVPVAISAAVAIWRRSHDPRTTALVTTYFLMWSGAGAAMATLASRIIYGLRERVREAAQLGQYVLEETIGRGGMGVVYRARHAMLRRPTAIKLLPPDRAGAGALARFEREVQQTARLSHPNTIAIYDYGHTPDGLFYYAMEYLDGISLDDLVTADGPMSPARVRHVLMQVCGALTEAHGAGLIHRDIKPANIMLCVRGGIPDQAKVLDFGLVKELENAGTAQLSTAATLVGTPAYLAPEAITAPDKVDARSDVYALGATAYHLLVGTPPFEGRTLVEICSKHLTSEPVPPSRRTKPPVPSAFESIILRCLEKDPAKRPQTASELRRLLDGCHDAGTWTDEQARTWWRDRAGLVREKARRARTRGAVLDRATIQVAAPTVDLHGQG